MNNSNSNIESMGIFGKLINWVLETLFGNDYQVNSVTIFATLIGILFLVIGIIMLGKAGLHFFNNKKDEAKHAAVVGLVLFGIGAVALVVAMAYYNNIKNNFG